MSPPGDSASLLHVLSYLHIFDDFQRGAGTLRSGTTIAKAFEKTACVVLITGFVLEPQSMTQDICDRFENVIAKQSWSVESHYDDKKKDLLYKCFAFTHTYASLFYLLYFDTYLPCWNVFDCN